MTDYGIKKGYYLFVNDYSVADHLLLYGHTIGKIEDITKKLVFCKFYVCEKSYDETKRIHYNITRKKLDNGILYPYTTKYLKEYDFKTAEYFNATMGLDSRLKTLYLERKYLGDNAVIKKPIDIPIN